MIFLLDLSVVICFQSQNSSIPCLLNQYHKPKVVLTTLQIPNFEMNNLVFKDEEDTLTCSTINFA